MSSAVSSVCRPHLRVVCVETFPIDKKNQVTQSVCDFSNEVRKTYKSLSSFVSQINKWKEILLQTN